VRTRIEVREQRELMISSLADTAKGHRWHRVDASHTPASTADVGVQHTAHGRPSLAGERVIAWIRVLMAAAMLCLLAAGDKSLQAYPTLAWIVVGAAFVGSALWFAVIMLRVGREVEEPVWLAWALTITDSVAILTVVAVTGAGLSLYTPLMLLIVIALGIRFALREAMVVAMGIGVALAGVILFVPEPSLAAARRVELGLWWLLLVLVGAGLVGYLSRLASEARYGQVLAEAEARAEHRRLDEERKLRRRLQTLEQNQRDFLHAVTHDFQTPITSLESLGRVLADQEDLDAEQRRHALRIIEGHARYLGGLLASVREVALAESLGTDRTLQLSDVFFPERVEVAAAAAGLSDDRLECRVDPEMTVFRTDADKMQRILTNLIENAVRHSPADECIEVELTHDGGWAVLRVMDRGPGMTDDVAQHAFDKFFGFGERRGSSGLGMWIVAQMADALGGHVGAERRSGGGLIVKVRQPYLQPAVGGFRARRSKESRSDARA
jgi:signal transduction histidine kinase